jgi:hypothetical protein
MCLNSEGRVADANTETGMEVGIMRDQRSKTGLIMLTIVIKLKMARGVRQEEPHRSLIEECGCQIRHWEQRT